MSTEWLQVIRGDPRLLALRLSDDWPAARVFLGLLVVSVTVVSIRAIGSVSSASRS
jgi:hypothetical protein